MTKKSIIITPVYRNYVTQEEMASIAFGKKYLNTYEKVIVAPQKLSSDADFLAFWKMHQYRVVFFDDTYFDGITAYNRMMLTVDFYKQFVEYEYILLYQLDALVLSDTLETWLTKGYDYVGAPWIAEGNRLRVDTVGNGGLSLRRVETFIKVLESDTLFFTPNKFTNTSVRPGVRYLLLIKFLYFMDTLFKPANKRALFLRFFTANEDFFWSFYASYFIEDFNVADPSSALKFAFESHPQFCYATNNNALPLGVHAWFKHDLNFWKEHIPELEKYVK